MKCAGLLSCAAVSASLACSPQSHVIDRAAPQTIPHPDDPAGTIEFFVRKPTGIGPWPAVVFLHGHQERIRPGGRDFVEWGVLDRFAERGYVAVAVSQPGYGNSSGPPDFSGPFTQAAVSAVLAYLRSDGSVAGDRIVIQGISRGAIVAGRVAARDPAIAGIVLISGVYDLPRYVGHSRQGEQSARRTSVLRAIAAETPGTPGALKERSVLDVATSIRAAALIMNGEQDDRTDPSQAEGLAQAIRSNGGSARAIIFPGLGHHIPPEVRDKEIDAFVDELLKH